MWISFYKRLLTADNLTKRGIHITIPCMLFGVNRETVGHIFLHCPFILEFWALKRDHLALSSWSSSIASLWSDWKLSNIMRSEVNRWDCVVTALIWVVWHERNQMAFRAKPSSIVELGVGYYPWWHYDNLTFHSIMPQAALICFFWHPWFGWMYL